MAHSCPRQVRTYATVLGGAGGGPEEAAEVEETSGSFGEHEEPFETEASTTSSSAEARSPSPGLHPRPRKEVPPVPRPRNPEKARKRRREKEEGGRDRRKRTGPPVAAPEGAPPCLPLSPKSEDISLLVAPYSPPPPREYGGRVASPNESAYLEGAEILGGGQSGRERVSRFN